MLFGSRFKSLAPVGAIVTVFALTHDAFVEQILTYPVREISLPDPKVTSGSALTVTANPDEVPECDQRRLKGERQTV